MHVCCVVECKNKSNSPGIQFYSFSIREHKKLQREKWINAVNRKNPDGSPWQPKHATRICSQHFIGNRKSEHPLSPSFIPTIFSSVNHKIKNHGKAATERFERSLKRQLAAKVKEKNQTKQAVTTIKRSLSNSNEIYSDQQSRNQETQIDFLEEPSDCRVFTCNRYVYNNICEAEVQACLPIESARKVFKKIVVLKDKSCGTSRNAMCKNTAVGSDPIDLYKHSFVKCSIQNKETPCISNIYPQIKTESQIMECNLEDLNMIDIKQETSILEYQLDRDCKPEPSEDPLIVS